MERTQEMSTADGASQLGSDFNLRHPDYAFWQSALPPDMDLLTLYSQDIQGQTDVKDTETETGLDQAEQITTSDLGLESLYYEATDDDNNLFLELECEINISTSQWSTDDGDQVSQAPTEYAFAESEQNVPGSQSSSQSSLNVFAQLFYPRTHSDTELHILTPINTSH